MWLIIISTEKGKNNFQKKLSEDFVLNRSRASGVAERV